MTPTAQLARALWTPRRPPCSWAMPARCLLRVADPGYKGTTHHGQGSAKAPWSKRGVDGRADEKPTQGSAAADHSERVGQGGEGRGYEEGYQELCRQRTFERRWKKWRA